MLSLRRIHHVCLRVDDLPAATERWSIQFGFTPRPSAAMDGAPGIPAGPPGARALLACDYEPYSVELVAAGDGEQPGHDHTGFELAPGTSLADAAAHLDGLGIPHRGGHDTIHLRDPEGNGVQLVPYAPADDPRPPIARSTTTLNAFHPRKLGHVNFLTADVAGMTDFYRDALGMRITDRLGDEGVWLHVNSDHHVMALVGKGYSHIHHFALELIDWGELRVALDHLAQHGRWLGWGPARHGVGRNIAAYVRIPEEECFVELFCDMETLEPGHTPRDWPDNAHSSNTWGTLPPRSYFRFDAEALRSEREGLEALGHPLAPLEVIG
ncbi:MAG: VOC family protein [Solirubrobacteraceae bacterium]